MLKKYGNSDFYPYHMPGHKRIETSYLPQEFTKLDITEIEGFDNLHDPNGIIKEAMDFAAKVIGTKKTYFLVNGSTAGVLAAISACVKQGGKMIMARNAHKSAYNAVGIKEIRPSYIYPRINPELGFAEAVTPEEVLEAIGYTPDAEAVFIVSPTYEGRIADIRKIAEITHKAGMHLIVDEAHGAHLPFAKGMDGYGESAVFGGADIVIQSAHKTLPAPTQTALLHICSEKAPASKIERYLHIYQTSSPSYPLMAGLDGSVRLMAGEGTKLLSSMKDCYTRMVEKVNSTAEHIRIYDPGDGCQDIGKCLVYVKNKNAGKLLADTLRNEYRIETEMCCESFVLAMFTVADKEEAYDRLAAALLDIDKKTERDFTSTGSKHITGIENEEKSCCGSTDDKEQGANTAVLTIAESWERETENVSIDLAEGRIVGDFVNLYPPGTPLLVPGEKVTKEAINSIKRYIGEGLNVIGTESDDRCVTVPCIIQKSNNSKE